MQILIDKNQITEIIPQRMPMVMIDRLLRSDEHLTETSFEITSDNILCRNNFLSEAGLIENMAQTCAARAGYDAKMKNEKVRIGFIGAIKNLKINELPKISDVITTQAIPVNQIGDVSIINATVFLEKTAIAECELKIFLM
jgi:predicted hotdog family 3-hydroxylacyl-ACP dehydratase